MIKVLSIFGTRPEAIKMCPLVNELKRNSGIDSKVCVTGQHREMLDSVLNAFNVEPDYDLNIMKKNQTLFDVTSEIMLSLREVLDEYKPDLVLVHGDTSTTFAAALACFYSQIRIGHVEAGLRTYDIQSPFPEEFNRQAVSIIANLHFAPTENAYNKLISEGVDENTIFVTGNTAIDALKTTVNEVSYSHPMLDWATDSRLILLTAHRRENIGNNMKNLFSAMNRITLEFDDVKILYPIHMNPKVRDIANEYLDGNSRVKLIEPLEVLDFHNFLNKSYLIVTDSGGIQEEAPSLGKPVLVFRDTTERPEGIEAGTLKLVGTTEESLYTNLKLLLSDDAHYKKMSKTQNPYGDGTASKQIVQAIITYFEDK
uniref:UDP-N-acetylglucosamine 2-epimerase (non-hydrolyzing) n=1 Tax=Erysipelothrix rhusiopathiae TaxID=1648 RepID=A0A6S6I7F7_ERYRH|nr:UDP-N-acetylglucosamine 2-epimerase [Erysipelothrix rhusiopathiae]